MASPRQPIPPAPEKDCPSCGKRMQNLMSTLTTHPYVCYNHEKPVYFNDHYTIPVDGDGKIKVMDTVGRRRMSGKV